MKIFKASMEHLKEIEKLSNEHYFEPKRNWKELIPSMYIMIDKEIIGFSGLIEIEWNNTIQISNIFIHPKHRNKGLAKQLIQHVINEAKKTNHRCIIAEAPSLNPVKKLYEKMGFRKCGYNDRYYSNNGEEICIWMSMNL